MGIVKINSDASLPVAYIIIIWYINVLIIVWDIVIIADQVSSALRSVKTWLLVERTRQGFFYEKETCLKQLFKTTLWGLKTIETLSYTEIQYYIMLVINICLKYYVNSNSFLERTVLNYQ